VWLPHHHKLPRNSWILGIADGAADPGRSGYATGGETLVQAAAADRVRVAESSFDGSRSEIRRRVIAAPIRSSASETSHLLALFIFFVLTVVNECSIFGFRPGGAKAAIDTFGTLTSGSAARRKSISLCFSTKRPITSSYRSHLAGRNSARRARV
jgi:hypothetical protein